MVFACLQDPRKEVIPSRGLFTQMVGLRLKDLPRRRWCSARSQSSAARIATGSPATVPGTGYVIPEDGGHPIRVRAGFASDGAIRTSPTRSPPRHRFRSMRARSNTRSQLAISDGNVRREVLHERRVDRPRAVPGLRQSAVDREPEDHARRSDVRHEGGLRWLPGVRPVSTSSPTSTRSPPGFWAGQDRMLVNRSAGGEAA